MTSKRRLRCYAVAQLRPRSGGAIGPEDTGVKCENVSAGMALQLFRPRMYIQARFSGRTGIDRAVGASEMKGMPVVK